MEKMMLKIIVNEIIKVHKYNGNDVEDNGNDGIEYESEMMILNIICISVIAGLVSITPGHVKLD